MARSGKKIGKEEEWKARAARIRKEADIAERISKLWAHNEGAEPLTYFEVLMMRLRLRRARLKCDIALARA